MPDSVITPRSRRKRRRLLKASLLLVAGLCICALFPNQTLNPLIRRIAPMAANYAGWELQLDKLSGAPWQAWRLEGLSLKSQGDDTALKSVQFDELRVSVDSGFWFAPGISQIQEVWGRGGSVHWVANPSAQAPVAEASSTELQWDPSDWPRLDLTDCQLQLQRPGIDRLDVQDLRLGLKPAAQGDATRTLSLKIREANHQVEGEQPQTFAFDGLMHLLGKQLQLQECRLSQAGAGNLALEAKLDLNSLTQPLGTFAARCTDWPVPSIGVLNARAEGAIESTGLRLESLDARSGRSTTLRLARVSVPWPNEGQSWLDALLPAIDGELVAGGSDLDIWLKRFGGERDSSSKEWPLGSYRLEASVANGVVQIQQARITLEHPDWPAALLISAQGALPIDSGHAEELQVSGLVSVGQGRWSNGPDTTLEWPSVTGEFAFNGAWPSGSGHFELHPSDVRLTDPEQAEVTMRWSGRCDLDQGNLTLSTLIGRFGTPGQGSEMPGELLVRGILPSIQALTADARSAPFDLQADLVLDRLAPLRSLLPSLRRIEGRARGQVSISGTATKPLLRGSIEATADSLRFTQGEAFKDVSAKLDWFDSSSGTFEVDGQYGGAPVTIQGHLALAAGQPQWDATVHAENFPLLRSPDARIRADSDLQVEGRGSIFDIQGDVYLTQGRLYRDFDLAGSLLAAADGLKATSKSKEPEAESGELLEFPFPVDCNLRVGLHTRKPVELISDLGRSSIEIEGVLVGRAGRLYPEGTVVLNGGRISLPGSSLAWKQGVVLLPKGGGIPTIEAQGTTRLSGHDVALRIHGPLYDPLLDLSSTPQRPDYDLLILLLTGELPQGRDWSRTTESLSLYLAKDVLKRWLGSDGGDGEGLFDRFEFTTGREVSESGLGTLEAMFRLNGDPSGQGKALWITAERDRYEYVNFGLRFVLSPR
ncbi:MAG: hypothetical protein ACI9X4_000476 [Glaciecola sp.]|jgi:hypothetical protein